MGMYGRLLSVFDGILTLAKNNQAQEALILLRSVIEDDFRLRQLQNAGEDRDRLVIGYILDSLKRTRSAFSAATKASLESNMTAIVSELTRQEVSALAYLKRRDKAGPIQFKEEKAYAQESGRWEDYFDFSFLHHMVHGNDLSLAFARDKSSTGILRIRPIRDQELAGAAALMAAEYAVDACEAIASMFSWTGLSRLGPLRAEIKRAGELAAAGAGSSSRGSFRMAEDELRNT